MSKLSILDAFGLTASGDLQPGAKFAQVFPQYMDLRATPLDKVSLAKGQTTLAFAEPIPVSTPGLTTKMGATSSGRMRLIGAAAHVADGASPFDSIAIHPDEVYVNLGLDFTGTVSGTVAVSDVSFGLAATSGLSLDVFRRFTRDAGEYASLGSAVASTLSNFLFPQTVEDLGAIEAGTVLVLNGSGSLRFSATFGISMPTQQLAATSPIAGHAIAVNATAGLKAGFGVALAGGYQIRLCKKEEGLLEIGLYRTKSREFSATLEAGAAVSAHADTFELTSAFIGALSKQPDVDRQEFERALPGEDQASRDLQIAGFERSLRSALATSVQADLKIALSKLEESDALWTFEVDLAKAVAGAANTALTKALQGDFTILTAGAALPNGITQTDSKFTDTSLAKQRIDLNLLGIVNFFSLSKLARISTVHRNAAGSITLATDAADQSHLQALLMNGGGDTKRLRALLNEDFLLQASFQAAGLQVLPPEFMARHTFFEVRGDTSRQDMKNALDVCRVTGLLTDAEEQAHLQTNDRFGRTTFWVQARYKNASLLQAFLDSGGKPRTIEDFESQARTALSLLLAGDPGNEFRKQLAGPGGPASDALWAEMKKVGNASLFNSLFHVQAGVLDKRVEDASSDYRCITSWAKAMNAAAAAIVETMAIIKTDVALDDPGLSKARDHLRARMADVVKNSQEHFGDPLGLVMVYLASGRAAEMHAIVSGDSIGKLEFSSLLTTPLVVKAGG